MEEALRYNAFLVELASVPPRHNQTPKQILDCRNIMCSRESVPLSVQRQHDFPTEAQNAMAETHVRMSVSMAMTAPQQGH